MVHKLICAFVVIFVGTQCAIAEELHVVFARESQDAILREKTVATVNGLLAVLSKTIPSNKILTHDLPGNSLKNNQSFSEALAEIRLKVDEDDTVFFFYCGHGACNEKGERYITCDGGYLSRDFALAEISKLNAPLTLFLTDMCSAYGKTAIGMGGACISCVLPDAQVSEVAPGMKSLFFEHRGLLDLTSSKPFTRAISFSDHPTSVFGEAAITTLETVASDNTATWEFFCKHAGITTAKQLRDYTKEFGPISMPGPNNTVVKQETQEIDFRNKTTPIKGLKPVSVQMNSREAFIDTMTGKVTYLSIVRLVDNSSGEAMVESVINHGEAYASKKGNDWTVCTMFGEVPEPFLVRVRRNLGITISASEVGARVDAVLSDSPATHLLVGEGQGGQRYSLEPGDVILAVNGVVVVNVEHAYAMIMGTPGILELKVRDRNDGTERNLVADLGLGKNIDRNRGVRNMQRPR